MHAIDARARAALDAYLRAIDELHPETIETIWLYGSVVLGAYVHWRSDVDVVALVEEPLEDEALRELHARARELDPLARWVQGLYVTASDVAVPWWSGEFPLVDMAFEPPPYPRGEFLPTTRLCIHQAGVTLKGESPSELLPVVDAHDLREEMTEELDWLVFKTLEPELFLHDYWVDHAAGMVSRILVTLDTGRVVGKPEALSHLARYLPQWERVAAESLSRLDEEHRLRPESRERADTVIAMVRDVREYVRERWPLAYRRRQKTIPTVAVRPVEAGDEELVRAWWAMPALRGFAEEGERPGEVIEADGVPVGWIDPHRGLRARVEGAGR